MEGRRRAGSAMAGRAAVDRLEYRAGSAPGREVTWIRIPTKRRHASVIPTVAKHAVSEPNTLRPLQLHSLVPVRQHGRYSHILRIDEETKTSLRDAPSTPPTSFALLDPLARSVADEKRLGERPLTRRHWPPTSERLSDPWGHASKSFRPRDEQPWTRRAWSSAKCDGLGDIGRMAMSPPMRPITRRAVAYSSLVGLTYSTPAQRPLAGISPCAPVSRVRKVVNDAAEDFKV